MRKERFYYGRPWSIASVDFVVNSDFQACGEGVVTKTKPLSRVTICGIYDTEKNTMSFGVARCSHRDQFVKSVGRDLSYYRANESPYKVVKIGENRVSDVFMTNAMDIESEVESQSAPITVAKSNFTPVEGVPIF